MLQHSAQWWKVELFSAEDRWVNGGEVPATLPGSSLPIILPYPTELSIEAEWFEHLTYRARTMGPSFVVGKWRYDEAKEPLVNFGKVDLMERQALSTSIILPAGNHEIHFEARTQFIGAPMGVISLSKEAPFRMAVKVVRQLK